MSWVTEAFGRWYPVVYPHRDGTEAERLVATLERAVPLVGCRLLDVGCGPGRHLVRIARRGARPSGLDLSADLLAEARRVRQEAGGRWPLVRGDMRALPFPDAAFDGVTSLFTSFGYFDEREDRLQLAEAGRVLRPGGFHVLDFLNREQVLAHPTPVTERVSGAWRITERRRVESGRRVIKAVEIRPEAGGEAAAAYEERVTLYGPDELRALLRACRLAPRAEWGDYDGAPFDPAASPRHVVLSVKEPA